MKKLFLLLLVLSECVIMHAQTNVYHPFPLDSAVWLMEKNTSTSGPDWERQELLGDTMINSIQYKKVYNVSYNYSTKYFIGGLRQDITNKKVYLTNTSGIESVLYDFNMAIGDTIYKKDYFDTVLVSEIDSTLVGNIFHKSFILSSTNKDNLPGKIIEGVGSVAGLLYLYEDKFEISNELFCFSINNIRLFPSYPTLPTYGPQCVLSVSVEVADISQKEIKISISPNPTKDNISLSIGCKDKYTIEIINNLGQSIYSKVNLAFSDSKIDLSNYQSGIYFVRISDSKGNFVVKKIVKE